MGFHGDLCTINLADLLQSMASRQQTGLLEITTMDGRWQMSLREGQIVGLTSEPPQDFWQRLVLNGMLTEAQFTEAKRKARRHRALAEVLIERKYLKPEALKDLFVEFVYDQLCGVMSLRRGRVELRENEFIADRNWAALGVRLPVTKVLFEAARRTDDLDFVRRYIPGPGTVFIAVSRAQQALEAQEGNQLAASILGRVGPNRSIGQIADSLPYSRTQVFREAAELVKHGLLRQAEAAELMELADQADDEDKRINVLLQAHREEPANVEVLTELAAALTRAGRARELAPYLKVLANVHIESGRHDKAIEYLREMIQLTPQDPAPMERLFHTLRACGALREAEELGVQLTARLRELGLHDTWCEIARELVTHCGPRPEYLADLGRAEIAAGRRQRGVRLLRQAGKEFIHARNLMGAEGCYRELAQLMPKDKRIKEMLERVRRGTVQAVRRRRRRAAAAVAGVSVAIAMIAFGSYEAHARARFLEVTCRVVRGGLEGPDWIEEAIREYSRFQDDYRGSIAALFDAREIIRELKERRIDTLLSPSAQGSTPKADTDGRQGK